MFIYNRRLEQMAKNTKPIRKTQPLVQLNSLVAGIDIGSTSHFIAISSDLDERNVREVGAFTRDLKEAASWLKSKGIQSVAMESTGVYWIPFYEILEAEGIQVLLVNAKHVKNVPGRKSDVMDCQWLLQLHSYGLLRGAFRPEGEYCTLRSLMRQRAMLVEEESSFKLRMQKALMQMNLHLHNVMSDITGDAGLKIMRDIVAGIYDPKILAMHRTDRYKCTPEDLEKSLEGNYRCEHIFSLKQALDLYDFYQIKIQECDEMIQKVLDSLCPKIASNPNGQKKEKKQAAKKRRKNELYFEATDILKRLTGVDLTEIDGLESHSVLKIIGEIGTDMSKWLTVKHFTSWLGLAPGTKISGGKILSSRTKKCKNKAAGIFRIAAYTLLKSKSAIGAFLRRKKAQLGAPEAITAAAHKIARIFYTMLKEKRSYKDLGADYYEQKFKDRTLKNMELRARSLGYILVKNSDTPTLSSQGITPC